MGEGAACLHRNTAARRRQRRGGGPPRRGTPSPPRLSSCKPLGKGGSGGGTGTVCCHSAPLPPAAPQHGGSGLAGGSLETTGMLPHELG